MCDTHAYVLISICRDVCVCAPHIADMPAEHCCHADMHAVSMHAWAMCRKLSFRLSLSPVLSLSIYIYTYLCVCIFIYTMIAMCTFACNSC